MNASTETVRLLMEIGLMAAGAGLIDEAGKIFEGVRAVRPDDASPLVGLAIAQIHSGRPHDAVDTLETA